MNKTGDSSNRDPITGKPGAHPVGVGAGAAAGGAAGAAIGSVVGPAGTVVGAAVGAVAGGLAGKSAAESINPTVEDAYWKEQYAKEPYFEAGRKYNDYAPAYRTGYEGYTRYEGRPWTDVESKLESDYNKVKGDSGLAWDRAKSATRAAWHRVERALPGDADGDGR